MKKLLIGLLAVVVLVVAALFIAPPLLGNSLIKSRIVAAVKEETGRDLEIGQLDLALLPSVTVSLRDLRLANAEDMPSPDMVRLGRLDFELALFPLISKKVMVERLVVSDLAANLEVNEAGRANWVFPSERDQDDDGAEAREAREPGAPLSDLRLGDVRLENARIAYRDQTSGQSIEAKDLNLTAQLPDIASKLALTGGLVLNGKPVDIDLGVDTPEALMTGAPAKIAAAVTSELVNLRSDLDLAQQPQPAVDGGATVEIGSVGALLAWLEQPLPADQPDPGPVRIAATFNTEGAKVLLEEAVVEGEALDLKAQGSFESVDGANKVALTVDSGVLDIDRYLPPPADAPAAPATPTTEQAPARAVEGQRRLPMEAIPDEPFDLSALRQTEADVRIALAGIKAAGYEVGTLALTARVVGGKLEVDLSQLALYGGGVTGTLGLDASGEALGVMADFAVDQVDLGALSAVASAGEAPVAGTASGRLTASGSGVSPRALVQDLKGGLELKVGEVDVKNAAAGKISGVDLSLDLPGLAQPPRLTGEVVYNKRKVVLQVGLDPLDRVLSGDDFALLASVESELVKLDYDGSVQQQPLPGLDGRLTFASSSLGQLAAWLGQPLPDGQPDPGPLEIDAKLAADGEKAALESASITGKAVSATASGSYDGSGEILRFDGKLDVAKLDLNAYLPPPGEAQAAESAEPAAAPSEGSQAEGWSDEPIAAFSQLGQAEGELAVTLANVLYREVQVQSAAAQVALADGVLKADVAEVQLTPGRLSASAVVDGSGEAAAISYRAAAEGVESKPFLLSFAEVDFLSGKLNFEAQGEARGNSQKALVGSLNGDGKFAFLDGAIEGFDLAGALRNVRQLGLASGGEKPKTDFSELSGSFTITDGVLVNQDLKMLAPLVRVAGAGEVPLPPRTLDYKVEAKLVPSLEGQGGTDALAGLPIPVHAYGSWSNLSYDVDYEAMFEAAAADPARLANLPSDIAEKAAQFGVDLPIPGLGDGEGLKTILEGATGGAAGGATGSESGEGGGGLGGVVEGLLGGKKSQQPETQGESTSGGETSSSGGDAEKKEPALVPELGKQLKGLFD